ETITSRIGFSPVQARVVTFQRAEGSGTGAEVFALVAQADMQESANVQTFDARSFCPELRLPSRVVTRRGTNFHFLRNSGAFSPPIVPNRASEWTASNYCGESGC